MREFLHAFLIYKGYEVSQADDADVALGMIENGEFDLVIADLMKPKLNGHEFVKKLKSDHPEIVTIVCSTFSDYATTASLLKAGAFICLDKPFNLEEIETHVKRGLQHRALRNRTSTGKPVIKNRELMSYIVGESEKIISLLELLEKVAESDSTVLILGESGTGKELVARAIHDLSNRKDRNFIPVNCAAIPDDLLESELFGHMKGAFTGAVANRLGRFEMGDKGTVFLDEIGDMKANLQVKLLRVLQNKEIEPVGGGQTRKIDTRFIAATNQNLEKLVEDKVFREDLYYRLSVIPIVIPPLRERKEDIPLLVDSFIKRLNSEKKRNIKGVDKEAMTALCKYSWPGNIRELENLIERLVILRGSGAITIDDLPQKYVQRPPVSTVEVETEEFQFSDVCFNTAMEELENRLIMGALEKSGGNQKEAAQLLNLKRTTFIEKLKKKNIYFERPMT
jgi:DNA-binding NtrC family response regulator